MGRSRERKPTEEDVTCPRCGGTTFHVGGTVETAALRGGKGPWPPNPPDRRPAYRLTCTACQHSIRRDGTPPPVVDGW